MNDRQLLDPRSSDYAIVRPARSRSLWNQMWLLVLRPGAFFGALPSMESTRQWLWMAILVLVLVGLGAVQQSSVDSTGGTNSGAGGGPSIPDIPGDLGLPDDFGAIPGFPETGIPSSTPTIGSGDTDSVESTWMVALIAGTETIVGWLILMVLLSEVSLLNGFAPRLGHNFQIAIWTSVPLALMIILQTLYFTAGGGGGATGLSGLVTEIPGYENFSPFVQALALSLASHVTLFWLWSLWLIYQGARRALNGKWWSSLLVVVAWVAVIVIVPVATGAVEPAEAKSDNALITSPSLFDESFRGNPESIEALKSRGLPPGSSRVDPEKVDGEGN